MPDAKLWSHTSRLTDLEERLRSGLWGFFLGGGVLFAMVSYTLTGPGLELTEIYLPLPPEYWAYGMCYDTTPGQEQM